MHPPSHAAVELGKQLFPLFAVALDLPEDYFADKVRRNACKFQRRLRILRHTSWQTRNSAALMRVLHYPPQTGPIDDRIIGIGAHTE